MFNVFNHTNFGGPEVTYGVGTFGKIFSAREARDIQLALKYMF